MSHPRPPGVLARLLHDIAREARGERVAVHDALHAGRQAGAVWLTAPAAQRSLVRYRTSQALIPASPVE